MNKFFNYFKQVYQGKTIYRILFNWQIFDNCQNLNGEILDLASGENPSYLNYLPKYLKIIRSDIAGNSNSIQPVDINKLLPYQNESFADIFLFNAIYIVENQELLMKEIFRVLKPGGRLFIASPLIAQEMPEPHDYKRYTYEGLENLFKITGFENVKIIRFGERFTAAAHLLHSFFIFKTIRLVAYAKCLLLDKLIPKKIKRLHPCPLGYFCVVYK